MKENHSIKAEQVAAGLMKFIMTGTLILMVAGLIFMALGINTDPADHYISIGYIIERFKAPNSTLFFSLAAGLLLTTPILVSLGTGVTFLLNRQYRMALISFSLFTMLIASIIWRLKGD